MHSGRGGLPHVELLPGYHLVADPKLMLSVGQSVSSLERTSFVEHYTVPEASVSVVAASYPFVVRILLQTAKGMVAAPHAVGGDYSLERICCCTSVGLEHANSGYIAFAC